MSSTAMSQIKTIVVLVQENRSFDHILGWMKSLNPEIDGVTGQETNLVSAADPNSAVVHYGNKSGFFDLDPGHSVMAIYEQVYGVPYKYDGSTPITPSTPPLMNGFAQQAESEQKGLSDIVMNGFKPEMVPIYKELVQSFAVCDRWFASLPASTQPNRQYVHSATSHGLLSNDTKRLVDGMPQKTIFDSLDEEGKSFGIYYQDPPVTLFYRNLRKLKYVPRFHQYDLHFKNHCKKGKLPNYVVIEQRFFDRKIIPANDDHPKHDVYEGQKLVKEVYEALRSSPQWNEMLFVIVYDEHGGLYDHVPSPVGVPSPDGIDSGEPFNFKFDRLGVRVPAIFISPWIESGSVLHKPSGPDPSSEFEHSSIPATVKKIFNLKEFLTKRDAWAGTFETLLTRTTPRTDCPVTLAEPVRMRKTEAAEEDNLTEFQEELVQMGAVLNGHHTRDTYPHKVAEGMTVAQGSRYMHDGMKKFLAEGEKCQKNGADESHVVVVNDTKDEQKQQSFAAKVCGCFTSS